MTGPKKTRPASLLGRSSIAWERWGWMVDSVARRHGVTVEAILSPERTPLVASARADLCVCLHASGVPYAEIGRLVGRDHTTAMYLVRKELAS